MNFAHFWNYFRTRNNECLRESDGRGIGSLYRISIELAAVIEGRFVVGLTFVVGGRLQCNLKVHCVCSSGPKASVLALSDKHCGIQ